VINILRQLHFAVSLAPGGAVSVTHNELPASSARMASGLQDVYGGMEGMIRGFFDTWAVFVLYPPLPENGTAFQLETLGSQYRLTYDEDAAHVATTLSGDFAVTHIDTTTTSFASSIWPRFTRSPQGFVLASYNAQYQTGKPDEATQLQVLLGYQQVSGMQLVRDLKMTGTYGSEPIRAEVGFTNCRVTKTH